MVVLAGARVVAGGRLLDPGWIEVSGQRLNAVGDGEPPSRADHQLPGRLIVPGFVDQHVHGGGGFAFDSGDREAAAGVVALHRQHGTTSTLASLVTTGRGALESVVSSLAELAEDGVLDGLHLEGPWLSPRQPGAHEAALLREPNPGEVRRVLAAGRGHIRMVTLATELPGGLDAVRMVVDAGAVAAIGHTGATYAQTRQALAAGATGATHLFNAMPPLHHRDPGPVAALLEDQRVTVEVIADGVHVHPAVVRLALDAAGPGRVALITDAMAAAGASDGQYRLGGVDVTVTDGVARLASPGEASTETGAIAGSTLTMDAAFRFLVHECGASVVTASAATATTPAAALGLADVGVLVAGRRADLVVLNASLQVEAVMRAGEWVSGPPVSGPVSESA